MIGSNSPAKSTPEFRRNQPNRRSYLSAVDGQFQWRYSFSLALSVGLTLAVFMAPFLYLLNQNFEIFYQLAMSHQPDLVSHLEREVRWITTLGLLGLVAAVGFSILYGFKLTGSIIGPLFSMERHMKKIAAGDWAQSDFRVRSTDEFKRLASSYAHLYKTIRNQTADDLELLERIQGLLASTRNQQEARLQVHQMIADRQKRLGLEVSPPPAAASDPVAIENRQAAKSIYPVPGLRPQLPDANSKKAS